MNDTSQGKANKFLIIVISFIIIIPSVAYYFIYNNVIVPHRVFLKEQESIKKAQEIKTPKTEALAKLELANVRVEKETKTLDFLVSQAQLQKSTINNIEVKYKETKKIIDSKVDPIFNKPITAPAIKIVFKDTTLDDGINTMRKELQVVMDSWKKMLDKYNIEVKDTSKVETSDVTLSQLVITTQKNIDKVDNFVQDLKILVDTLTTTNSNLSQTQINSYKSIVDSALADITKINSSIESINISNEINPTPIVTPVQIKKQEEVLEQAKSDLAVAQSEAVNIKAIDPIPETPSSITPDTTLPSTKITNLTSGESVSYTITVSAFATDPSGIDKVEFFSDGVLIGVDTTPQYSIVWDTTTVSEGEHELSTKAYDTTGNVTISNLVSVVVSNNESVPSNLGDVPDPELIEGANKITF